MLRIFRARIHPRFPALDERFMRESPAGLVRLGNEPDEDR